MEVAKFAKLRIDLRDVSGCGKISPGFVLEINGNRQNLMLKGSVCIESLDLNLSPGFTITAFNGDKLIGSLKTNIDSLITDKPGNRAEKWLKVKTEEFQNFRIKVGIYLSGIETQLREKPKEAPKPPKSSTKLEKIQDCPYLSELVTGHHTSSEPLDEIWRSRNISKESSIKLSLQPDTIIDSQEEVPDINSITPEVLGTLSGNQLKKLVKSLCEEIKSLENISKILPELQNKFNKSVEKRRNLGQEGRKGLESLNSGLESLQKSLSDTFSLRNQKKSELLAKQEEAKNLEIQRDKLRFELSAWQEQNQYLHITHQSDKHKSEMHAKLSQGKSAMGAHGERTFSEIQGFLRETSGIKEKIKACSAEYENTKGQNDLMKKKINELNAALGKGESLYLGLKARACLLPQSVESRDNLNSQIKSVLPFVGSANEEIKEKYLKAVRNKGEWVDGLVKCSEALVKADKDVSEGRVRMFENELGLAASEAEFEISKDLSGLSVDLSKLKHLIAQSKSLILPDLSSSSEILLKESEKTLTQSEKLDHMIESVDHKESQLNSLQSSMGQIQKRQAHHVAVKSDPIDVALADYLLANPVSIKFTRTDAGNYIFGSTKIHIKLENNKLIVKVRGGTTSIEEFLRIYTPLEVSKNESPKSQRGSVVGNKVGKSPGLNSSFVRG